MDIDKEVNLSLIYCCEQDIKKARKQIRAAEKIIKEKRERIKELKNGKH